MKQEPFHRLMNWPAMLSVNIHITLANKIYFQIHFFPLTSIIHFSIILLNTFPNLHHGKT